MGVNRKWRALFGVRNQVFFILIVILFGCAENQTPLYRLTQSIETGVDFSNKLTETESLNYFNYPYLYMGGGVAVGDFNNDGLEDLFFTANQEKNRLYLNKGRFKFEDITESAGVGGDDRWYTGVSVVDINADGWMDIYVSVAGLFTPRTNELWVNNGDLTFTESADSYGIADDGYSYQGTFFDYDVDGDLDLLVINYTPTNFGLGPQYYRSKMEEPEYKDSDHLYENIDGKYVDRTEESGILNFGLTISSSISDFNQDGLPDIYLCNDFASRDFLFLNTGNKTFKEVLMQAVNHTSMYSMGSDAADLNNDGLSDLVVLDMNAQDNFRNKANMSSMNIPLFWSQVENGLHYQYMHNTLLVNNGIDQGIPKFSDVARLSGVSSTDWSWSALFLDVNNDAKKDLFVSNGTRRDINNKDFFIAFGGNIPYASDRLKLYYTKKMPSQAIPNYLYQGEGHFDFKDISLESGINESSFSNGAAYADLDNDGDLDLVVNNIDQEAFLYENTSSKAKSSPNYLQIELEGKSPNPSAVGAKVYLFSAGANQFLEQMPTRGFQSTSTHVLHFGLGSDKKVDSVQVIWPDGSVSMILDVESNQRVKISQEGSLDGSPNPSRFNIGSDAKLFAQQKDELIDYVHQENEFDDFDKQVLLPHKMSQFGPAMAIGDLNGDGLEDLFLGGSVGQSATVYLQNREGSFVKSAQGVFDSHMKSEDVDAIMFDADGDSDLDVYVVSGGNEFNPFDSLYQDRLYLNDGAAVFVDATHLLPGNTTSGSFIKAFDYDQDGDQDLLLGGRHIPHNYPMAASSFIFENRGGDFIDVTAEKAPFLKQIGLVTDGVWTDLDGDGAVDFILVGEWMEPVIAMQRQGNSFTQENIANYGLDKLSGWWYSISDADLDNDGDQDLVLGNLGLNYKYQASADNPFKVFTKDFDNSGSTDIVLSYEQDGNYYPVRGRECSSQQIPDIKKKFKDYNSFANADIINVYGELGLESATELQAHTFASMVLLNDGESFRKVELPNYAQVSSVNDMVISDVDGDQKQDLILVGNLFTSEVETTRNDAGYGWFLKGKGDGKFTALMPYESGFLVEGDSKKAGLIQVGDQLHVVVARNDDKLSFQKLSSAL